MLCDMMSSVHFYEESVYFHKDFFNWHAVDLQSSVSLKCTEQWFSYSYIYIQEKKAKWLSEEALQIAEKRRDAKGKGKKERYAHLKAEFQRRARGEKKVFLSDQCKEIEENNRIGKTRDLFKKIRDTKGTFHENVGTIKGKNGMDLTEAEDTKRRWQQYTEELYKKRSSWPR